MCTEIKLKYKSIILLSNNEYELKITTNGEDFSHFWFEIEKINKTEDEVSLGFMELNDAFNKFNEIII